MAAATEVRNAGRPIELAAFRANARAARLLDLSPRTLEKHRCDGTGPVYHKLGGRVVYAVADLEAWVDGCARQSTSGIRGWSCGRHCALSIAMSASRSYDSQQLELFRARAGDIAARDAQD